jgi:hypothetical protein
VELIRSLEVQIGKGRMNFLGGQGLEMRVWVEVGIWRGSNGVERLALVTRSWWTVRCKPEHMNQSLGVETFIHSIPATMPSASNS